MLRGLDKLISNETNLPVHIADDPLSAVAEGTGVVLHELEMLRRMNEPKRTY
jgi:rod shape-determining protein MreB